MACFPPTTQTRPVQSPQPRGRALTFHGGRIVLWGTGVFTLLTLLLGAAQNSVLAVPARDGHAFAQQIPFLSSQSGTALSENVTSLEASQQGRTVDVKRILDHLHRRAPILSLFGWNTEFDNKGASRTGRSHEESNGELRSHALFTNSNIDSTLEVATELGQPTDDVGDVLDREEGFQVEEDKQTVETEGWEELEHNGVTTERPESPYDGIEEKGVTVGETETTVLQNEGQAATEFNSSAEEGHETSDGILGATDVENVGASASTGNLQLSAGVKHSGRVLSSMDSYVFEGDLEAPDPQSNSQTASEEFGVADGHARDSDSGESFTPEHSAKAEEVVGVGNSQFQKTDEQAAASWGETGDGKLKVRELHGESAKVFRSLPEGWIPLPGGYSHRSYGTRGKPTRQLVGHVGATDYVPFDEFGNGEVDTTDDTFSDNEGSLGAVDVQSPLLYDDPDQVPVESLAGDEGFVPDGGFLGTGEFGYASGFQSPSDSEANNTPSMWEDMHAFGQDVQYSTFPHVSDDRETERLADNTDESFYSHLPSNESSSANTGAVDNLVHEEEFSYRRDPGTRRHNDSGYFDFIGSPQEFEGDEMYGKTQTFPSKQGHQLPPQSNFFGEHETYQGNTHSANAEQQKNVFVFPPRIDLSGAERLFEGKNLGLNTYNQDMRLTLADWSPGYDTYAENPSEPFSRLDSHTSSFSATSPAQTQEYFFDDDVGSISPFGDHDASNAPSHYGVSQATNNLYYYLTPPEGMGYDEMTPGPHSG